MALLNLLILKASLITVVLLTFVNAGKVEIGISHFNDISGQIQAFKNGTHISSKAPEPCTDNKDPTCIGGFLNVVHWLFEKDDFNFGSVPDANLIKLSSGNIIGGESGWISAVDNGWTRYAKLVNGYMLTKTQDFAALGMKEFGAGVMQTKTFVNELKTKTGVANTCDDDANYSGTEKAFCDLLESKFKVVELNGNPPDTSLRYKIGIIGFVTPTVEQLSLPGQLKFSNVSETIRQITEKATDIPLFIAVGDGNLKMSKEILDEASKVKLVIYGAGLSNTNISVNPQPYKQGFIATAGRYGSSVGKLHLEIDTETDEIELKASTIKVTVTPTKLNPDADKAVEDVQKWNDDVNAQMGKFIGQSSVPLEGGETCWKEECIIGNLMTDAVVHCVLNRFELDDPFQHVLHSVWHGGAFFEDKVDGKISEFDVHKWLPYHNNVHLVKVKGSDLKEVFKISATGIDPEKFEANQWRQFLQVSNGFQVFYDTTSEDPEVTVRIVHDDKGVPEFDDLVDDKEYHLAIPTYLFEGRGVYNFSKSIWVEEKIPLKNGSSSNVFDDECLEDYIKVMRHISVGLEERIWVNKDNGDCGGSTGAPGTTPGPGTTSATGTTALPSPPPPATCPKKQKTAVTVTLTIVFYTIILAIGYVGYFYVLPRLRRPPLSEEYPPNQL